MDTTLQVKIKALVEGLQEVAALGQKFLEVAKESEALDKVGPKFDGLGKKGSDAANEIDQAWKKLGGSSTSQITKQIEDIKAALDKVKTSGASFDEISRATQLANTRIAELNKQLQTTAPKSYADTLSEAFAKLGGRSTEQVKKQIEDINRALADVKNSGAGFEEVARATQLAEAKLDSLNRELQNPAPKSFGDALGGIATKLKNMDFKGAVDDSKALLGNFGGITSAIGPMVTAFAALAGLKALGALAKDAADAAAKVETMGVVMTTVGRNAGYSEESLLKAAKGVEKMGITSSVARESITQMIQSGIKINEMASGLEAASKGLTKAQELARAAQDLAVVSGEGSSETLQRLIINMQQMDVQGLKFMGLLVNTEAANEKYAASLGKSADALTVSERRTAFQNATMAEAAKLQGAYGDALETVGKKLGSLARYQEQFLVAIGQNLTPAYGALVDAVTDYLKYSEKMVSDLSAQSNASKDLKEGLAPVAGLLGDIAKVLTTIAFDVFLGATRVIKPVGEAIGEVWNGLKAIYNAVVDAGAAVVKAFSGSEESAGQFMRALDPIQGFFTGLKLIVAAVSDGISILVAAVQVMGAAFLSVYGDILLGASKVAGFFNEKFGQSLKKAGEELKKSAETLDKSADKIVDKFADGKSALGKFADELERTADNAKKASPEFTSLSDQIDKLADAQRSGGAKAEELAQKLGGLRKVMDDARTSGNLTAEEYSKLSKQLAAIPSEITRGFEEAFQSAKLNLGQLRNQITEDVATGLAAFDKLIEVGKTKSDEVLLSVASSAKQVAGDVLNVFDTLVSKAKSLNDLAELSSRLQQAQKEGIISQQQYNDELRRTSLKFDEVFQAALKAAKTEEDFEKLAKQVKQVGDEGGITGTKVVEALKQITTQATGLSGVYKELYDAQQKLAQFKANLSEKQAELDIARATAQLMKDSAEIYKARYAYEKDGTELSKVNLQIAENNLQIDQLAYEVAKKSYEEAKTSKALLIEQQKEMNALKKLELDASNEIAQKEAAEAKEKQASLDLAITRIQQERTELEGNLLTRQKEGVLLEGHREQLKAVAEVEKDRAQKIRESKKATDEHNDSLKTQGDRVKDVSSGMDDLYSKQRQVVGGYTDMELASSSWSGKAIAEYLKVSNAISGVIQAQKQLDQATGQSLTYGSGAGSTGTRAGSAGMGTKSGSGAGSGAGTKAGDFQVNDSFAGGMVLPTWLSIYNQAKSYGLPDNAAREIAESFAPNGVVKYENNPAQMRWAPGGGSMGLAVQNAAAEWIRTHPNGEGSGGLTGSRGGSLGTGATGGLGDFGGSTKDTDFKPSSSVISPAVQSIAATPTTTTNSTAAEKTIKLVLTNDKGQQVVMSAPASQEANLNSMLDQLQAAMKRT